MKRKITGMMLAVVFLALLLGGCGNSKSTLSFNNAFSLYSTDTVGYKDKNPSAGYKETLSYDVIYNADDYAFKKDSSLSDGDITVSVAGTYVSALEILSVLPASVTTDIERPADAGVYRLTTELRLNANYTFPASPENNCENEDYIVTETYFFPFIESFLPVWSKTTSEYTNVTFGNGTGYCTIVKSEAEIIYNSSEYTINSRSLEYRSTDEEKDLGESAETVSKNYEYTVKTVIDNTQLIFALRNINLATESTYVLPVVSSSYGQSTDLLVKNNQEYTINDANISYNGSQYAGPITLKEMIYSINSTNTSGSAQYVYIQKEALKNGDAVAVPWISAPYRIVTPLTAYGSFYRLGSLVFTLGKIEITEPA